MKPKIGHEVNIYQFKGHETGSIVGYDKDTKLYSVTIGKTLWSMVPYKKDDKFKGPIYIDSVIK